MGRPFLPYEIFPYQNFPYQNFPYRFLIIFEDLSQIGDFVHLGTELFWTKCPKKLRPQLDKMSKKGPSLIGQIHFF